MLNDKMTQCANFTCFHAGPMEGWTQFRLEPPDVPLPARGGRRPRAAAARRSERARWKQEQTLSPQRRRT